MNKKKTEIIIILLFLTIHANAQNEDTIIIQNLIPVTVKGYHFKIGETKQLGSVHQTYITAGKKHEVIIVQDLPANLAEKTGRQVFAKIPGAFVYDMDGSGNQVNISTRGLDPHRSWEYNVRQNGVMTNSDIYAYPASHYSPPMEAIQRIEVIRGTASLQYGAQFGGMFNYIIKQPDTTKAVKFESLNSIGSFGLLSSYNAIGGRKGKFFYYGYYQRRISDGYRENARSDAQAQYLSLKYDISPALVVKAEIGRSQYVYQMPGPLTDQMFYVDPRQSTRARNYFSPDIYVPSFTLEWQISPSLKVNWVNSAVLGNRSSVQFIGFADSRDTIEAATRQYKPRQVDIDHFNSYTSELRLQKQYHLGRLQNVLLAGLRYIDNSLHRQQLGKGTTGSDFDLTLSEPSFGRDLFLKTQNFAFFIENLFRVSSRLDISTGVRLENGESKMSGVISYLPNERVPQNIIHQYPLLGVSAQFKINENIKLYGGWSQAYRPVVFSDMIPANNLEQTDPEMKDAFGYNAEIGIKGRLLNRLTFDANLFQILYRNRIGSLILTDNTGQPYVWRTNIGDSKTNGAEVYLDVKLCSENAFLLSVFTATSWFDGFYLNGLIRNGNENTHLKGNALETVPKWISRNGLQFGYRRLSAILQFSYVSKSYSDALNTENPSPNGAKGLVPSYRLWDLNLSYRVNEQCTLKLGVNNFTNEQYFTKRPAGYPGSGVWSSDGRSIVASVGIKI